MGIPEQYQFNSSNWDPVYTTNLTATVENNVQFPIENFTIPIQFDSHVLAVFCSTTGSNGNWHYGGKIYQKIQTGIVVGGTPSESVSLRKIWLNRISLLFFKPFTSTYSLEIEIPRWFPDFHIDIFEYTGQIVYPDSQAIARIEEKVNQIHTEVIP